MITTTVFPGRYVQGYQAFSRSGYLVHHEPTDVSPDAVIHALLAADGEGRRRKG